MTRLSSRLTVTALAIVALAALFGLGAPRPRAAARDRLARTAVRTGSQRTAGQSGADDHQADAVITSDDLGSVTRPASAASDAVNRSGTAVAAHTAWPDGTAFPDSTASSDGGVLLDRSAPCVRPDVSTAARLAGAGVVAVSCDQGGPASGRAPPTV